MFHGWVISDESSLLPHPWWLIRRRLLEASKAGKGKGKVIKIFVLPGVYKRFCRQTPAQFPFDSQMNKTSREELFLGKQVEAPLAGRSIPVGKVLPAFSILQFLALTRKPSFRSSWNKKLVNFDFLIFFEHKKIVEFFFFSKQI